MMNNRAALCQLLLFCIVIDNASPYQIRFNKLFNNLRIDNRINPKKQSIKSHHPHYVCSTSSIMSDVDKSSNFHTRQYQYYGNNEKKTNRWKSRGFIVDALSSLLQNAASAVVLLILWGISKCMNVFYKFILRRDDCADCDCAIEWAQKIDSMRAIAEEDTKISAPKHQSNLKELSSRITEELDDKMIVLTVNNGPLKGDKLTRAKEIAQQKLQEIAKLEADQKQRLALKLGNKSMTKNTGNIKNEEPTKKTVFPQVSHSNVIPTSSIAEESQSRQANAQDSEASIIAKSNAASEGAGKPVTLAGHQSSQAYTVATVSSTDSRGDGHDKIFYDDSTNDLLDVNLFEVARAAQDKVSDLIGAVFDTVDDAQMSAATAVSEATALLSNTEPSPLPLQMALASRTNDSNKNFLSIRADNGQSSSGGTNADDNKEEGNQLAPTSDSDNAGTWEKIKSAGISGVVSYVLTELGFWILFPVLIYFYEVLIVHDVPNLADPDDRATIIGMTVGFLTLARIAVPARFALALSLIPFVEERITKPFLTDRNTEEEQ